jgi:ectoine hydroxylase-related dioxygenase (phytanoyl-CoA dioxygenase family)
MTTATFERHPWNTSFEWTFASGGKRVLSADQAEQFDAEGYVVLEGVLDANEVAEVVAELDEEDVRVEGFLRTLEDERLKIAEAGAITFTPHAVTRSERLRDFSKHPVFRGLCTDVIGPDANLYWDQGVYKKPEKPRRFPWHQDNGYTFVEPQHYLTCWIALTDATERNGCPWVAPGLHRQGTLKHTYIEPLGYECFAEPPRAVAAPVRAGGIVVFSSLTPHLTGPNTTDDTRKAYILQYAPPDALIQVGDPEEGPPTGCVSADAPDRQFPVVRDGMPV